MSQFVKDKNDPSGYGMFSKAGRFTTEKYSNALQQFQNLFTKPPKRELERFATEANAEFNFREHSSSNVVDDEDEQSGHVGNKRHSRTRKPKDTKKLQPFGKYVSREKAQSIKIDKYHPPPCGYYTPKDGCTKPGPKLILKFSTTQQNTSELKNRPQTAALDISPVSKPVKGHYEMDLVLSRDKCLTLKTEPNEKRFEYLHTTDIWTKQPYRVKQKFSRTPLVHFSKQIGRKIRPVTSPDVVYSPDYSKARKQPYKQVPSFMKVCSRKPNICNVTCLNQDCNFEFDQWSLGISTIFPKQKIKMIESTKRQVSNFNTMLSRDKDHPILPGFMQKNINNRMILDSLHQKMLESNSSMTPTQTNYSSKFSRGNKSFT